jgi:hypothetical protein
MPKLPKKQFWYCWCGRLVWTDSTDRLTAWLFKHYGAESKCQKYKSFSPLWWYNIISLKINNWYWGRKLTTKLVTMDETGVTSREIKP